MRFIRRDRPRGTYTHLRVGLFFLAAGVWVAGVLAGDDRFTAVAIGVAVLGLLAGLLARRSSPPTDPEGGG